MTTKPRTHTHTHTASREVLNFCFKIRKQDGHRRHCELSKLPTDDPRGLRSTWETGRNRRRLDLSPQIRIC